MNEPMFKYKLYLCTTIEYTIAGKLPNFQTT